MSFPLSWMILCKMGDAWYLESGVIVFSIPDVRHESEFRRIPTRTKENPRFSCGRLLPGRVRCSEHGFDFFAEHRLCVVPGGVHNAGESISQQQTLAVTFGFRQQRQQYIAVLAGDLFDPEVPERQGNC